MRLRSTQIQQYYVVLMNGGEVMRNFDEAVALRVASECRCTYPGATVEVGLYRNGRRVDTVETTERPIDAVLGDWGEWTPITDWGDCIADEQVRTERRQRVVRVPASNGGVIPGALTETREVSRDCEDPPIDPPVDCVLAEWSDWMPITNWGPCIGGFQSRTEKRVRGIATPPANGGAACGDTEETRETTQSCQVAQPPSPDGFKVPQDGAYLIDNAGVRWEAVGSTIYKNGEATTGWGTELKKWGGIAYHRAPPQASPRNWYYESAPNVWVSVGVTEPGTAVVTPPPPPAGGTLREFATTGTVNIATDPYLWTLGSVAGLLVGDWMIVATGSEPGAGEPGTKGVGGTVPNETRANLTAIQNDAALRNLNRRVGALDTGFVWQWNGSAWVRANSISGSVIYFNLIEPKALQGQITNITGSTIRLNVAAQVSVTGANVYLDAAPDINALAAGTYLPAGDFAIGGEILRHDFLAGQGITSHLFAPDGAPSISIVFLDPEFVATDLKLTCNFREKGYGTYRRGSTPIFFIPVTDFGIPQGTSISRAFALTGYAPDSQVKNVTVIDPPGLAVWMQGNNGLAEDVDVEYTWGIHEYLGIWTFNSVNGSGHTFRRATVTSPTFVGGFETAFGATGAQFIDCSGTNVALAANSAGGYLVQNMTLTWETNSWPAGKGLLSVPNSMVQVTTNAGRQSEYLGGILRNMTTVQEGYLNAAGVNTEGLVVGSFNPRVRVEGWTHVAPDYNAGTGKGGSQGIRSFGDQSDATMVNNPGTYVQGMHVTGLPVAGDENRSNIKVQGPNITNGGGNAPDPRTMPGGSAYDPATSPQGSMHFNRTN